MSLTLISAAQSGLNRIQSARINSSDLSSVSFKGNNCDSVSFRKDSTLPEEVKKDIPEEYSIQDIIKMSQKDENISGTGANSVVYTMPFLENHVLKVLNKDDPNKIDPNEFPSSINLGQPIWQDPENPRILILKKITGKENSIPNWSRTIYNPETMFPEKITKQQALAYYDQIQNIASMDQSAFDQLASDVKFLEDNHYKLDSINANNLLVDTDKQEMHIVDYFKVKPKERDIYQNCHMDLTAVMLDFTLFPEFYDKLDEQKQNDLMKSAHIINQKNRKAAENSGLSTDVNRFKKYIRTASNWFTAHSVPKDDNSGVYYRYYDVRCDDFLKMLNEK